MSISTETALEILGVPSYATVHDITIRYLSLVIHSVPGSRSSIEDLRFITSAFLTLVFPERKLDLCMSVGEIYAIFQSLLNGLRLDFEDTQKNGSCNFDSDVVVDDSEEERKADTNAIEIILEEEKEKLKAERKKARKKRRKEKKKQQKPEQESKSKNSAENAEKIELQRAASNNSSSDEDEDEILARRTRIQDPKDKEDIDASSEFVACIAGNRWITLPAPTITVEDDDSVQESYSNSSLADDQEIVLKSRELAFLGNAKANMGEYAAAIRLFSEAINLNPADHRFYGNRSYCYEHIRDYAKALRDADMSISLCPTWGKNYFRKGKALLGLQRFDLAEECFLEVLKHNSQCEDAISHLHTVKILQIIDFGYSLNEAETALSKYGSVKESLMGLVRGEFAQNNVKEADVFVSDDEYEESWKPVSKTKQGAEEYDIKKDPKNPEQHNSLWIGNVQPTVTEKMITSLFSKYGELLSVRVMPEKFCAFVNYKSKASPGKAMAVLQGYQLHGGYLEIRFPNLVGETTKLKKKKPALPDQGKSGQGPINGDECYFWRTTGCIYGPQCRFKHIKAHKGIDKQTWMDS